MLTRVTGGESPQEELWVTNRQSHLITIIKKYSNMQNSILMKDTQLFLTEGCLSWLFLFIYPSNLSPSAEWGKWWLRTIGGMAPPTEEEIGHTFPSMSTLPNKIKEQKINRNSAQGWYLVQLLHNTRFFVVVVCLFLKCRICSAREIRVELGGEEVNHKTVSSLRL